MTEKLLPCPFCGTSVISYADLTGDEGIEEGRIACGNSDCGVMMLAHYEGEAIEMWNRRDPPIPRADDTRPQPAPAMVEELSEEQIEKMRLSWHFVANYPSQFKKEILMCDMALAYLKSKPTPPSSDKEGV